jgi:hypothetical protein
MDQRNVSSTKDRHVRVSIVRLPMHIVCMRHLIPGYLAPQVTQQTVGLDTASLAAVTREVYWFVLARELETSVNHFCRVRNLQTILPSRFAERDNAFLIGSVLSIVSIRVFEGHTSPQIFHGRCAAEIVSSPWNTARVGFFLAFSMTYRTLNTIQALEALLIKISYHVQVL